MSGWIKLHRSIQDHWIFKKVDYFKAWILLLIKANHKEYTTMFLDQLVHINRGETILSYSKFGLELGWSSSKVRRFLKLLEKDKMIVIYPENKWTHLSILNYETYQYNGIGDDTLATQTRNDGENNIRMIKKNKNEKKTLSKKEQLDLIKKDIKNYKEKFPNVDVDLEYARMCDWLLSSGKLYKNYKAFFNNWLRKADTDNPKEDIIWYVFTCNVCKKQKDKSTYRDLYVSCCDKAIQPIKEYV